MSIDPFILNAWLAGIGIALMSAPVGCFIAWQRLVYFGDTVAHASFLGVAISLLLGASPLAGIIAIALVAALLVSSLHDDFLLPSDTLLGIIAHASLALGLVILARSPMLSVDINGLLFGDILAVGESDLITIYATAAIAGAIIFARWKALMRFVLHPDIAQVEGVNTKKTRLLLMTLIALIVGISIKLVGILLITSLLILPAAAARLFARSPSQMIMGAALVSMAAVTLGLFGALQYDTPAGASIILAAALILILSPVARQK